ncbi:ClpP/crotonase-like domain-containing protein [Ilyonectria sp. MPI-CAGE-AT-0026]|nr:ClpP/crotonase-like domain-containing protein [Ilyonectria sp. MPI-CAGE-AT-0026]
MSQQFSRPPPVVSDLILISYPAPHLLLVTLNRPEQLNAMPRSAHIELFPSLPSLRCAVITGKGKGFCAGTDLKDHDAGGESWLEHGFGGMSNRRGKKPIIAAVNGHCFGGGFEVMVSSDFVIASESAKFGLPEVTRGIAAVAGALPRLICTIGRQRASEITLLGHTYSAKTLYDWGILNRILPQDRVLDEALLWAVKVATQSPDVIILNRAGLLGGWDGEDPTTSTHRTNHGIFKALDGGVNMKEGILSFVEKRNANWIDGKL